MPLDEGFADFLSAEIEKHVRSGMSVVEKRINERLDSLIVDIKSTDELILSFSGKLLSEEQIKNIVQGLVDVAVQSIEIPQPVKYELSEVKALVDEAVAAIPAPKDGTSVTIEDVAPLLKEFVQEAVAAIPAPKDGTSVTIEDVTPLIDEAVSKAVTDATAQIEFRQPEDGKSVTIEDVAPLLKEFVQEAVAAIPAPKDGTSVTIEDVTPLIDEAVSKAVAAIPAPKDGTSVTIEDVKPVLKELVDKIELPEPKHYDIEILREAVQDAVSAIPAPKDGVAPSLDEVVKSIQDIVLGKHSQWLLERERIENDRIEKALQAIPTPRDGKDAFELEDIDVGLSEDGKEFTIKFQSGERSIEKSFRLPTIVDKGVFKENSVYEKGDAVSFGGSLYIVQKNDPVGKPDESKDFRLAVKRGRDGKEVVKLPETGVKTVKAKGDA